jgi:hypothetical protein
MNQTAYIQESEGYAIARGWANAQWREACNNLFNN